MSDSNRAADPNRRLAERLHGIAGPSMAVIIGNMIQEMIFELQIRESQGCSVSNPITLTDAEREAIERACRVIASTLPYGSQQGAEDYQTLRGLLERLSPPAT